MSVETAVLSRSSVDELIEDAVRTDGASVVQTDQGAHESWRVVGVDAVGPYVLSFVRKCAESRQRSNWSYQELRGVHARPYHAKASSLV